MIPGMFLLLTEFIFEWYLLPIDRLLECIFVLVRLILTEFSSISMTELLVETSFDAYEML